MDLFMDKPANEHVWQVSLHADVFHVDEGAGRPIQVVADAAPAVPSQHGEADNVEQDLLAKVYVPKYLSEFHSIIQFHNTVEMITLKLLSEYSSWDSVSLSFKPSLQNFLIGNFKQILNRVSCLTLKEKLLTNNTP